MAPDALAQVLRPLAELFPAEFFPQLQVGLGALSDDAAVYKLREDLALVATLDFFTPVVDDPYTFGAIAAANALSDVYAMNAQPALALNIACLSECLPPEIIAEVLRGGAEKVLEAGAVLAGGHSVDDQEPKYGLVAIGLAHPDAVWTKAGARPGDALLLTKPLGVGMITTVAKADEAAAEHVEAAVASMLQLNRAAAEALQPQSVHACTDVTGFALLGHASEMARKSGVTLRFESGSLPWLPGAVDYADTWLFPAGTGRNKTCYAASIAFDDGIPEEMQQLLLTPETSGGLLAAVPADEVAAARQRCADSGIECWLVGDVCEREAPRDPLVRVKS